MTVDKHNDIHSRDTRLARMLAQALQSQAAERAGNSACPDAEILAAYAEHGLAKEEAVRWESHFADCQRCQKIIAVLAVSSEDLEDAEIQKLGGLVAASAAREALSEPATVESSPRPALWRWLVPVFGAAAAVVLWFALYRPLLRETASRRVAGNTGISPGAAEPSAGASAGKPGETQMAQANLPPPPSAIASGTGLRDAQAARSNVPPKALEAPVKSEDALQAPIEKPVEKNDALKAPAKKEALQSEAQTPSVQQADRAAPSSQDNEKDTEATATRQADRKSQPVDALGALAGAAGASPAPAPAEPAREQAFGATPRASAGNEVRALAKSANSPVVFASPDRGALWRIGSGGLIERSADQGQTWQAQSSGVTSDLLAGAAPSKTVAWAVGRGGMIVRTEDGERWQRVTPPSLAQNAAPPDWIGVQAGDALHATIVSRDLHRFATEDGGRTWVAQR